MPPMALRATRRYPFEEGDEGEKRASMAARRASSWRSRAVLVKPASARCCVEEGEGRSARSSRSAQSLQRGRVGTDQRDHLLEADRNKVGRIVVAARRVARRREPAGQVVGALARREGAHAAARELAVVSGADDLARGHAGAALCRKEGRGRADEDDDGDRGAGSRAAATFLYEETTDRLQQTALLRQAHYDKETLDQEEARRNK